MAWDWYGYRECAEACRTNQDERCQRNAISRAYYFAHHRGCEYMRSHGGFDSMSGNRHARLIHAFNTLCTSDGQKIGNLLHDMRKQREKADYDRNFPDYLTQTNRVLTGADKIADLSQFQKSLFRLFG